MSVPAPVAGNQFFTNVEDAAKQFSQLNTSDLEVAADSNIGGDLAVTGDETVGGDLAVTGNETVGGNLDVTGNLTVTGSITPGTFTNNVIAITTTAVTRPVTAAESGSTFAITKAAAVELVLNLPTPALGLNYKFVQVSPAVGGNTIVVNATTNGTVVVGTMGGELQNFGATSVLVGDAAMTALDSTLTFAASSVASDFVRVECVSTNIAANTLTWVVNGDMSAASQIVPSV